MNGHDSLANEFIIERRLHQLDPELHKRFTDSLFVLPELLSKYEGFFPEFTDHSERHAVSVLDYCNQFMCEDAAKGLNADECYVLLMSCYLHDVGMGISEKDFYEFRDQINMGDKGVINDPDDIPRIIRKFHSDFSGCIIRKYSKMFDLPSETHMTAIIQTVRGHRITDLYNEEEYPAHLTLDNGTTICLPYLAALLRIADEMDVSVDRNSKLLFDPESASTEKQRIENAKHEAIRNVTFAEDKIILDVHVTESDIHDAVLELADKLQQSLSYCAMVIKDRSPYRITQETIEINFI